MDRPFTYRSLGVGLRLCAAVVPAPNRARWLEEWRAEVWHALQHGSRPSAVRRALGAPRDALWSRRPTRLDTPSPPGSPRRGIDALMQDIRYALRSLLRRPVFTLTAILMLAAGIGANAALFGAIKHALFEPLPWEAPERLIALYENRPLQEGRDRNSVSLLDLDDWRDRSESFESMTAFSYQRLAYTASDTTPISLVGAEVDWHFFSTLGILPALGRNFTASDDEPGANPTVILSHGLWQELFAGAADVVGQEMTLNELSHTIIGVMPDKPVYYFQARAWVTLRVDRAEVSRGNHRFRAFGRLHEGIGLEAARAELQAISLDLEEEFPDNNTGHYAAAHRFEDELARNLGSGLWIVLGLAAVVLLIVCANIANMQLASALARQREVAVRLAIGASRRRIVTMVLVESGILALVSATLGLGLARLLADLVVPPPAWQVGSTVDGSVFVFAFGLALGTSILFGLIPAMRLSRGDVFDAIRDGGRALGSGRTRLRGFLVATEVALAVVLVAGAGLLLRSVTALGEVELGFGEPDAVAAQIDLPIASYPEPEQRAAFFREVVDEMESIPGVTDAGTTDTLPLVGSRSSSTFRIEGREQPDNPDSWSTSRHSVTPGYTDALGIELVRGRTLQDSDNADSEFVTVVNDTFVDRFFPEGGAIGARISLWGDWHRIVGVVRGVRHDDVRTPPEPEAYFPAQQLGTPTFAWVVMRRDNPQLDLAPIVRAKMADLDPTLPIARVFVIRDLVDQSMRSTQRLSRIVTAFGTLALLIAAMGLYGVISYAVGQRQNEIGLRMALGSTARNVVALVVTQGMTLVGVGLGSGIAIALFAGPLLADVLYGVEPRDVVSMLSAAGTLGLVAFFATLLPAVRAARIDPAGTLRGD